jgi:hypothetical protein
MKKLRTLMAGLLSVTLLILAPIAAGAADISQTQPAEGAPLTPVSAVSYQSFTGKITNLTTAEEARLVALEDEKGGKTEFNVTDSTYIFDGVELVQGQSIIGFYDSSPSVPAAAIYPPRYNAAALAPVTDEYSVFVGLFDDTLTSSDNTLKLQNLESAKITTAAGETYTGALAGHRLAVTYKTMTMSMPAQTTPIQVIVLTPAAAETAPQTASGSAANEAADIAEMPILVNGQAIEAPTAYINAGGVVMLPLRPIAEALGYHVAWDAEQRSGMLNAIITVTVDRDYYVYARTAPIELGAAPELKDGRIYVPIQFFPTLTEAGNTRVSEGRILVEAAVQETTAQDAQEAPAS